MCGNCKYSNHFHYNSKEKYEKQKRYQGQYVKGEFDDPEIDNELYCTRGEGKENPGAVNRTHPYKQYECEGFGVGLWDRQYEWATCDKWELGTDYAGYPKVRNK